MEKDSAKEIAPLESEKQLHQRYSVLERVGEGSFSEVHKVAHLRTGHMWAAKIVSSKEKQNRDDALKEIDILNRFRHPNLPHLTAAFETPIKLVMVMEYMSGGELFERVTSDEEDSILYLRQICDGLQYMHNQGIVHLDLKPENIMFLSKTCKNIKIVDFGLAKRLESDVALRPSWGTTEFMPPEWNEDNNEVLGPEADVWSAAVMCYLLLCGKTPFTGATNKKTKVNIIRVDYDFNEDIFDTISQSAKDFMSSILVKSKEARLTAEECLKHRWLSRPSKQEIS